MKSFKRFLLLVFCALPTLAVGQVATTAGSNLTAWNGNAGSTNNNNWNQLMNNRTGATTGAKADFGNCNSLILRCAQPKCAACTTMELAKPVVSGCVNSNKDCKKHGDDLIEFIAAQIVASAAQKQQAAELAASQAAAQAAAAQNSQQMQQMQMQMQQMQQQMQQQNANQMAQMQAALDEQKQLVAQAQAEAAAAQQAKADAEAAKSAAPVGVTAAQQNAIDAGISEDVLFRQQASGEILTAIENAEVQLKEMEASLKSLFDYAGCDSRGANCIGPKRVKVFKDKARPIFDNFDNVADELYEALETALMLGVDVSDILMMLSGGCNKWGRYMCHSNGKCVKGDSSCTENTPIHIVARYSDGNQSGSGNCVNNNAVPGSCVNGRSVQVCCTQTDGSKATLCVKGGQECQVGMVVPPADDANCSPIGTISADEDVQRQWVDENYEGDRMIRVGCISNQLDSIALFAGRRNKKNKTLDIETLKRILEQDATGAGGLYSKTEDQRKTEKVKYCGLTSDGYDKLVKAINTQKFTEKDVCVESDGLYQAANNADWVRVLGYEGRYYNYIPEAQTKSECHDYAEQSANSNKVCWDGSRCIVRSVGGSCMAKNNTDDCKVKSSMDKLWDDDTGPNCEKDTCCGVFNFWVGVGVETATTAEEKCKMHSGVWLTEDQAEGQGFKKEGDCCKVGAGELFKGYTKDNDDFQVCVRNNG